MLNSKVGYSKNKDAYEAGKETATKATEGISAKIGLLFNSVGYDQKKLMEGIKSVAKDVDVIGCTSSAGLITPDGYMIDENGVAGMMTFDDENLTVACYGMPKKKDARETGRQVALKALEKAGKTGADLQKAIADTKFDGLTGSFTFDKTHSPKKSVYFSSSMSSFRCKIIVVP